MLPAEGGTAFKQPTVYPLAQAVDSMKLTCLQENLSRGLATVSRSVASRPQLPVLANILLATDKGRLKLSTTNLETSITIWLGAKVEKDGAITVPARILTEFVSTLPADKIELEIEENRLSVSCGGYFARFHGLAASEFPPLPFVEGKEGTILPEEKLRQAIAQVVFAAASDEARPVLTGVLLRFAKKGIDLVATDGYRLSVKKIKADLAADLVGQEQLIVPARALAEVARSLPETGEKADLRLSVTEEANQAIFVTPDAQIVTRLLEGEFPDFAKIIPAEHQTEAILDREELTKAVKMAAIFARESANIVRLSFGKDEATVSANTAQVGENKSSLAAKVTGKPDQIAFNSRYLLDYLGSIVSEELSFEMSGSLSPGVFHPQGDETFLHLIMPVRVQG